MLNDRYNETSFYNSMNPPTRLLDLTNSVHATNSYFPVPTIDVKLISAYGVGLEMVMD
jgi:hypothetical protein